MKKESFSAVKLGLFVLAAMALIIFTLYLLGKNNNIFGNRFELTAHFRDINGLLVGNNVRFSGIDVGRVRSIDILNDTVIEVGMSLDKSMKTIIRSNAIVSLGTDGLIGNRVVNISPAPGSAPFVQGGEHLTSREEINTQAMLQTLYRTNENVALIAEEVRSTVLLIKTSSELTNILSDKTLSANLHNSLQNLNNATQNAALLMDNAVATLQMASTGKGTLATALTDTTLGIEVKAAVAQIKVLEASTGRLINDLHAAVNSLENDIQHGNGSVNTLMRDSVMAAQLRATIDHVDKGTAAFAENMEALKGNVLLRRYFKKKKAVSTPLDDPGAPKPKE